MTIDLNKILARQDYIKLTKSLRDKCDIVEDAIANKMVDLNLNGKRKGICVNGMNIFSLKGYLYIRTPEKEEDSGPYEEYRAINSNMEDRVSCTDEDSMRNFFAFPCSNEHALNFLNNAVAIIEELGKIEQNKVEAIEKSLEATKDL